MTPATEPQLHALRARYTHLVCRHSCEVDLRNMAAKHGFPVTSLDELSRAQATELSNRLDEVERMNNPGARRPKRR